MSLHKRERLNEIVEMMPVAQKQSAVADTIIKNADIRIGKVCIYPTKNVKAPENDLSKSDWKTKIVFKWSTNKLHVEVESPKLVKRKQKHSRFKLVWKSSMINSWHVSGGGTHTRSRKGKKVTYSFDMLVPPDASSVSFDDRRYKHRGRLKTTDHTELLSTPEPFGKHVVSPASHQRLTFSIPDDHQSGELQLHLRQTWRENCVMVNQLPIAPTQWKVVEHKAKVYDSMSASLHISRFSRTPLEKVQSEVEPVYKQFDIFVNKPTASCTYSRRICFACGREIRLARSKTPADMRSMLKSLMERASPSSCLTQDEIDIACPVYEVLIQDGSNKRWEPHEICKCIFTHSKYRAYPRVYYDGKSQKALSKQKKENERRILPSK